jgi:hypothetical protein
MEGTVEAAAWSDQGLVRLPQYLPRRAVTELAAEAREQIQGSKPYLRRETAAHRDGSFASPVRHSVAPAGPKLRALTFDRQLLADLKLATGLSRLTPRGATLVIYGSGEYQGLHTDSVRSTLTVGIVLGGELDPMGWAPDLRLAPADQLAKTVAQRGLFPEGDEYQFLEHPCDGTIQGWAGYEIPHWRPPHNRTSPAVLAILSFMDL